MDALTKFTSDKRHKDVHSCIVIIMSHGDKDYFITSDNEEIEYREIYNMFTNDKCPFLQGKPKLLIFQSCR